MSVRQRLLDEIAGLSLQHGIELLWSRDAKRFEVAAAPSSTRPKPIAERRQAASFNVHRTHAAALPHLRRALRVLRRANRLIDDRNRSLRKVYWEALAIERSAALTRLLRAGLDADPAFARIAAADTPETIRKVLAEVDERRNAGVG